MDISTKATRTVRAGLDLEASLRTTTAQAGEGLGSFFAPVIRPDESFDLTGLLVLKDRKLRWCREQVTLADLEHREQVERLSHLLDTRDEHASSLGGKLVDLRRVCLGLYDEKELVRLGLAGPVSQDPVIVYQQGTKAWLRFRKPGQELRDPGWLEVNIGLDSLVEGLGGDVQALGLVLVEISDQRRRIQQAAAARRQAEQDFDRNYQLIGSSTEADYRMAGLLAEAERARPSRRRGGHEVESEEPVVEAGAEPEAEMAEEGETPEVSDSQVPRPAP